MIVKNESRIIKRLLESVLPIIDTYCICDTGSTDDTVAIIKEYFKAKNIPGIVLHEPFKNFGHNRTFSLTHCTGRATYALLLDADMVLTIDPTFKKEDLIHPVYTMNQDNGYMIYSNVRLIRTDIDAKCVGLTHEHYSYDATYQTGHLDTLSIVDHNDGGSKSDKYTRDIRLLEEGLVVEPNNTRYMFYLAQSYIDASHGELTSANRDLLHKGIDLYKRRITIGGWDQEVWYCHLRLGGAYMRLDNAGEAILWYTKGYEYRPSRAETIYELCKYYRTQGMNKMAYEMYKIGKSIPFSNDSLFVIKDVYSYLFDYELSIIAYYLKLDIDIGKLSIDIINKADGDVAKVVYNNLKWYAESIDPKALYIKNISSFDDTRSKDNSIDNVIKELINGKYVSSTPSIFPTGNIDIPYEVILRYVNYCIKPDSSYFNQTNIITKNKLLKLDASLEIISESWLETPKYQHLLYHGIEDVRVSQDMQFTGTVQDPNTHKLTIGYGTYTNNSNKLEYSVLQSPYDYNCEKNWCLYSKDEFIYCWSPLEQYRIIDTKLELIKKTNMPSIFKHMRGSTCGFKYNNEIWFLTHAVIHNSPRDYLHCFVVFDLEMNLLRYTKFFKLSTTPIEYALGIIIEDKRIIISYSKMDRESYIAIHDRVLIDQLMI